MVGRRKEKAHCDLHFPSFSAIYDRFLLKCPGNPLMGPGTRTETGTGTGAGGFKVQGSSPQPSINYNNNLLLISRCFGEGRPAVDRIKSSSVLNEPLNRINFQMSTVLFLLPRWALQAEGRGRA